MPSPIASTSSSPAAESAATARQAGRGQDAAHTDVDALQAALFSHLFVTELGDGHAEGEKPGSLLPHAGRILPDGTLPGEAGDVTDIDIGDGTLDSLADGLPLDGEAGDLREWLALAIIDAERRAASGTNRGDAGGVDGAGRRELPAAAQGHGTLAREIAWRAEQAWRGDTVAGDDVDPVPGRIESPWPGQSASTPAAVGDARLQQLQRLLAQAGIGGITERTAAAAQGADSGADESLLASVTVSGQPAPLLAGADRGLSPHPALTLNTPMHQQPQWADEVGNRIRWMVNSNIQSAELKINPPQLGPIEVRISVSKDQMSVTFVSQHPLVRESLEEAAPRLREMMTGQGFTSVNVDVSGQQASGQDGADDDLRQAGAAADGEGDGDGAAGRGPAGDSAAGLIDFYA